jgi:hypothetical protein
VLDVMESVLWSIKVPSLAGYAIQIIIHSTHPPSSCSFIHFHISIPMAPRKRTPISKSQCWIATLPNEILIKIIQYILCELEYYDPYTLNVENVQPNLMYGFIAREPSRPWSSVSTLLKAFPCLRSLILDVFFSREVEFTSYPTGQGLDLLNSMSIKEVQTFPKRLLVPWTGEHSDVSFDILKKATNLESLQVLTEYNSLVHKTALKRGSLQTCPGWSAIMSIRGCKTVSIRHPFTFFYPDPALRELPLLDPTHRLCSKTYRRSDGRGFRRVSMTCVMYRGMEKLLQARQTEIQEDN